MTSLAAKLSVDSRGPSALYILTDSRITWTSPKTSHWDAGQKAFHSHVTADIFGFCGDAFFPPYALRQMIDLTNSGLLFSCQDAAQFRHDQAMTVYRSAIENGSKLAIQNFTIVHGARDGELMSSRFRIWIDRFDAKSGTWKNEELDLNTSHSYLCHIDGSGQKVIKKYEKSWEGTSAKRTSRAAFMAFCDALISEDDPRSGGTPQLVGIRRKGVAHQFGIIWRGKKYLAGVEVPTDSRFQAVQWFNQRFERMDGEKIKRLPGAQRHHKPANTTGL